MKVMYFPMVQEQAAAPTHSNLSAVPGNREEWLAEDAQQIVCKVCAAALAMGARIVPDDILLD